MTGAKVLSCAAALLALPLAQANCPNACSGHGECNKASLCECYANWMSADCSERVCSFGRAFVDTPLGDLDGDGIHEPQAAWAPNARTRVDSKDYLVQHSSELGLAEYGYARSSRDESWDEAHFYRECSNKGICDREEGVCKCFPGFGGGACDRAVCPNDCSGHGVCRTLSELDDTYSAWDGKASQQCVCDGGYTGPDCSKRMCPVGADPIEMAQVVDWSVQGIYFRTYTVAHEFTTSFDKVVEFVEDKPEVLYYTLTFEDEYGDTWTSSVQSLDYLTECQTYSLDGSQRANCLSTPLLDATTTVHDYLEAHANTLNTTLNYLPPGVLPDHFVWAAGGAISMKDSAGASCNLAINGQACGSGATVEQTSLETFPTSADTDTYVDSLEFRLDTNIISACEWDSELDFDGANLDKFGFCLFVKMPAPGIRPALKVNHWFEASGNIDATQYVFSEVSGETNGFTADADLDEGGIVVVQDVQSKRVWNSADGDLEFSFIDEETDNMDYCSKRGLCDFESGICNCFSGFSGLRCDDQNAVTYSF